MAKAEPGFERFNSDTRRVNEFANVCFRPACVRKRGVAGRFGARGWLATRCPLEYLDCLVGDTDIDQFPDQLERSRIPRPSTSTW